MATVGHVLKRLLLTVCGYVAAVFVGLVAVALIYAALSSLPGTPDYFAAMSIGPFIALAAPTVGGFVLMLAIIATMIQALVTTLMSEIFALRAVWLHMLFGALVSVSGFLLIMPVAEAFVGRLLLEPAIFAGGGAIGGLVYWLIAGRNAGFRRLIAAPTAFTQTQS